MCDRVHVLQTHALLGSKQLRPRWAVLDPGEAVLEIRTRPPPEDDLSTSSKGSRFSIGSLFSNEPGDKRQIYSLELLRRVDANPRHGNIFLRFEGVASVLCLTVESDSFQRWLDAFQKYSPDMS